MRRIGVLIAAAVAIAGCNAADPRGDQVNLLTGVDGCYAGGESGLASVLEVDPTYGTRFGGKPVMWPKGYTGWQTHDQVVIRDLDDHVVATTGRRYYISIAPVPFGEVQDLLDRVGGYPAAAGCPYRHDLFDCAAPPPGLVVGSFYLGCRDST